MKFRRLRFFTHQVKEPAKELAPLNDRWTTQNNFECPQTKRGEAMQRSHRIRPPPKGGHPGSTDHFHETFKKTIMKQKIKQQASPSAQPTPLAVDVKTASHLLGVSQRSVWKLVEQNKIHVCRIGRRVVFPLTSINAVLYGTGDKETDQ